jgi:hypothetical protein
VHTSKDGRSSTSCQAYRIAVCGDGRRVPLRAKLQHFLMSGSRRGVLSLTRGPCWSRSAGCGMSETQCTVGSSGAADAPQQAAGEPNSLLAAAGAKMMNVCGSRHEAVCRSPLSSGCGNDVLMAQSTIVCCKIRAPRCCMVMHLGVMRAARPRSSCSTRASAQCRLLRRQRHARCSSQRHRRRRR